MTTVDGKLDDGDYAGLSADLDRFPRATGACPVCAADDWAVVDELEHGEFVLEKSRRGNGLLVVSLVCRCCCLVRQFAWRGITRKPAAEVPS